MAETQSLLTWIPAFSLACSYIWVLTLQCLYKFIWLYGLYAFKALVVVVQDRRKSGLHWGLRIGPCKLSSRHLLSPFVQPFIFNQLFSMIALPPTDAWDSFCCCPLPPTIYMKIRCLSDYIDHRNISSLGLLTLFLPRILSSCSVCFLLSDSIILPGGLASCSLPIAQPGEHGTDSLF